MKILCLILFIASAALWLLWKKTTKQIADLTAKNAQLSRYEAIVDVEQELQRQRRAIQIEEQHTRSRIAQLENEAITQQRAMTAQKEQTLESARQDAFRIIEEANRKAHETAGDAFEVMRNVKHYEKVVKALKNTIEGYGEEYIVPNRSAVDDLAKEFSHKEAGIELKIARDKSRQMVATGAAAICDYVEDNRRRTAIHFVIDAFNGKIDSILSMARNDNYGKLSQQMKDAFAIVNDNGKAFRNARIQPDYLLSRLNELKWAVATNELRLQEQEEQRRIKEEMREEEKARREYEKAMRDAAKEEKMLQEAMKKAQEQLATASAEQRAEYERKLQELEAKVKAAEEKSQHAISMAQQTKRGHVYVISNIGSFGEDVFKIGLTRRLEPSDRIRELGDASVPFAFDVHAMIFSEDSPALESRLHNIFMEKQMNKVNTRKEFFKVGLLDIKKVIDEEDVEVKWTMLAEAREYRETLALEQKNGLGTIKDIPKEEPRATPRPSRPSPEPRPPEHEQPEKPVSDSTSNPEIPDGVPQPKEPDMPEPTESNPLIECPNCEKSALFNHFNVDQDNKGNCPHCNIQIVFE